MLLKAFSGAKTEGFCVVINYSCSSLSSLMDPGLVYCSQGHFHHPPGDSKESEVGAGNVGGYSVFEIR